MNNLNNRLFIDIHALQTLPPCNINRDDTGSPKTAQYGGSTRARVSSQCWKRAMRMYFKEHGAEEAVENVGVRTLYLVDYIAKKIVSLDSSISDENASKLGKKVLNSAGITTDKNGKSKALFAIGETQAKALAQAAIAPAAIDGVDDKKSLQALKKSLQALLHKDLPIDIALFGRMLADDPLLNEDASAQVAHAISTHAIQHEFDYFTAIDDLSPKDNAGASMLGTVEYNSSELYRYASIALHEFLSQLDNDKDALAASVKLFVKAFVESMPTGKVNTFANQTLPHLLLITLRDDRPVNLVSAFEEPVKSTDGYASKSTAKLAQEMAKAEKIVHKPLASFYVSLETCKHMQELGEEKPSMQALLDELATKITEIL